MADRPGVGEVGVLLDRLPVGWSTVRYGGRRWGVTVATHAGGRSVYAEELGGTDLVSANLYTTSSGEVMRPCEMPAGKVLDFLRDLELDEAGE